MSHETTLKELKEKLLYEEALREKVTSHLESLGYRTTDMSIFDIAANIKGMNYAIELKTAFYTRNRCERLRFGPGQAERQKILSKLWNLKTILIYSSVEGIFVIENFVNFLKSDDMLFYPEDYSEKLIPFEEWLRLIL